MSSLEAHKATLPWLITPTDLTGRPGMNVLAAYSRLSAPDPDRFAGRAKGLTLGAIQILRLRTSSFESTTDRAELRRFNRDELYISMPWHGRHSYLYDDVERTVTRGSMYLVRTDRHLRARVEGPQEGIYIGLPQATVRGWGFDIDELCAQPLPMTPVANTLALLGDQLSRLAPPTDHAIDQLLQRSILDMLHATLQTVEGRHPVTMPAGTIRSRAIAVVDALYPDPDLNPSTIAQRLGTSLRNLHRAFEETPDGIAAVLRERRLTAAAELLSDPESRTVPIATIASLVGFRGPSFRRAFTARFGLNPSDFRGGHPAGSPPA